MVFGFGLHTLTSFEGLFESRALAAADHTDVRLARELIGPKSPYPQRGTPALGLEGQLVLGDKAHIGTSVLTPKRSNMTRSKNRLYGPNEAVLVPPKGGPRRP